MDESTPRSCHPDAMREAFPWVLLPMLLLFLLSPSAGDAQVTTSITPTPGVGNLGTTVTQAGNVYNITGGTRPGNGPNLFHSFGDFSIAAGDTGNFLNNSGLATSNILGRVTGGNISNIYGTLQTTDFGSANLYLMNPFGIVLGPSASLNVGGAVSFTSAQYIRLLDGLGGNANFYANPVNDGLANSILAIDPSAFEFLSAVPAAYGFLTPPDPNATITVQGSALSVPLGQSISLVGGKVVIQSGIPEGGTAQSAQLLAPSGSIKLASAASPGEFDVNTLASLPNVDGASFASFGTINLAPASGIDLRGASTVWIKGGQLVLSVNDATLTTSENSVPSDTILLNLGSSIVTSTSGPDPGADVQITVGTLNLDGSAITTVSSGDGNGGNITADIGTLSLTNLAAINSNNSSFGSAQGGNVTVQGLQGTGSAGDSITLSNGATITSLTSGSGPGGEMQITTRTIGIDGFSTLNTQTDGDGNAGHLTLNVGTLTLDNSSSISSNNNPFFTPGTGQGGNVTVQGLQGTGSAADSITLSNGANITSLTFGLGQGGEILITSGAVQLNTSASIDSFTFNFGEAGAGGNILLNVNTLTLTEFASIKTLSSTPSPGFGQGGNVTVQGLQGTGSAAKSVDLSGGSMLMSETQGSGDGGQVAITSESVKMDGGASIFSSTFGTGLGGNILLSVREASLSGAANITSRTDLLDTGAGASGTITVQGLHEPKADSLTLEGPGTGIFSSSFGAGSLGEIVVHARTVNLTDAAAVQVGTQLDTAEVAGNVTIDADLVAISGASRIASQVLAADAGQVTIVASELTLDNGSIQTNTFGEGRGGDVVLNVGKVSLSNGAAINSSTSGTGGAGDIAVNAIQSITVNSGSSIAANTTEQGNAGNVLLTASTVTVTNGSQISTSAHPPEFFFGQPSDLTGTAGNIAITTTGNPLVVSNGGTIASSSQTGGNAGTISITSPSVTVDNGTITTSASSSGNAGSILAMVGTMTLTNRSEISSSSTGEATGAAGSVTIQGLASPANSVTIADSLLLTSAANTGRGGSITVDATTLTQNNATISASVHDFNAADASDGAAVGMANIALSASTMTMRGSTVTAESSGSRNAGDLSINSKEVPGNTFEMQNSTINTSAALADGGNIGIFATDMIRLTDSNITSSVGNPTKTDTTGGNITIDPTYVILQGSQIRANAFAGSGGAIDITAGVFLADPSSIVDASSTLGISGTVQINAPINNLSSVVGRLPESVLAAQALLRAACAARLAQGQVSSFVERGRDSIPTGPDGLLASPYLPPSSEQSAQTGGLRLSSDYGMSGESLEQSAVQVRRLLGPDSASRVTILSGDSACSS